MPVEKPQVQMQSMSIRRDSNSKIYSTTATFTSAGDAGTDDYDGDEADISVAAVDLVSFVATPRPRHKGHAFRPEPNHYTMLDKINGRYYLIYTFFMEDMSTTGQCTTFFSFFIV
jgi:hypothetical protein